MKHFPMGITITFAGWSIIALGVVAQPTAMTVAARAVALEVLWSIPITGDPDASVPKSGLVLAAQAISPDGRIAFLGHQLGVVDWGVPIESDPVLLPEPVLLPDVERGGAEGIVTLKLRGVPGPGFVSRLFGLPYQRPVTSTLAIGPGGEIWVGGLTNTYWDMVSYPHSDAYLARVDATGKPLWERAYGDGGHRNIWAMTAMTSGHLAVVGVWGTSHGWTRWLGRIAPDGSLLWERETRGSTVASLADDRLLVVGSEGAGSRRSEMHELTAQIVDGSGNVVTQTGIRNCPGGLSQCSFGAAVASRGDAIYVASIGQVRRSEPQPIEVAKLALDGTLLWKTLLPDTIKAIPRESGERTWKTCSTASLAIIQRGDAVVACVLDNEIHIYQLDGSSGLHDESYVSLPACQSGRPAALFLAGRDDGTIVLSGSRPGSHWGANCTWIGRLRSSP